MCPAAPRILVIEGNEEMDMPGARNIRAARGRSAGGLRRALPVALVAALLAAFSPYATRAAQCPPMRQPRLPPAAETDVNIDTLKERLRKYHDRHYDDDIALVLADARTFLEQRVDEVKPGDQTKRLAVVLDIDETSLSNWPNIKANDFGFIKGGPCPEQPDLSCGFDDWVLKSSAPAIKPTLDFFNAVIAKGVSAFFISSRPDRQRQATMWNLDRAGYEGWARLSTRPNDYSNPSVVPFKSGERGKIEQSGYTIIANVGDQHSDLEGGFAECKFKVPNPFYFIP
jgi:hypothetical protein